MHNDLWKLQRKSSANYCNSFSLINSLSVVLGLSKNVLTTAMSKLYIVPTPIGNLEDMTFRAIRILKEVDLILAEDTRTSGKLLKHFEIGTHMHSHHMHNEHKTIENLITRLKAGEHIALISDAGSFESGN